MKTTEARQPGESWLQWVLGNLLAIDTSKVVPVFAWAWLFKDSGMWVYTPRACGTESLFFNAVAFIRVLKPFGIFWSIRWGESQAAKCILQCSLGFKLNGRFTCGLWPVLLPLFWWLAWLAGSWILSPPLILLGLLSFFAIRVQSDETSEAGQAGRNEGQAKGYEFGPH